MQTEVLAPDIEVAPAANVEVPTIATPPAVAPTLASAPVPAPVPVQQSRATSWPTNWVNTWIALESWSRFNELAAIQKYGDNGSVNYRVPATASSFSLKIGSRIANYDGVEYWLGFAPQIIGGSPYVHWIDAQKLLQPLVRPARYCCINGVRTIVIDAGHGGRDLGANAGSSANAEKDYTLDWALRLQNLLTTNGWNVVMTRTDDSDLGLAERVAIADQARADFFLSLHFNSGSANRDLAGIETYCLTPAGMPSHLTRNYEDDVRQVFPNNAFDEQNVQAAVRLHRALLQRSRAQDRGVRRARFMTVLRGQNRPAVLIEGGYLTNPAEAQRIASASYRQVLAEAVATGLHLD
jgi:N-acetylmuramoyl-L-alanine amidase